MTFGGDRRYWSWIAVLLMAIATGGYFYLRQLEYGLTITGMSRDVIWGFYIAQFTFMAGIAVSPVMVVLLYYVHDFKAFGPITIAGQFLAISAVTMCMLFIVVDLGEPTLLVNVILHPSPNSIMFWDMIGLGGYLVLNVVISRVCLVAERQNEAPPSWIKPVILLSIPWAFGIRTVTAFIFSGLVARPFWLTAILVPRFLASAFSSGLSLLILLSLILKRTGRFEAGKEVLSKLTVIVTYAMLINIFFVLIEMFTAFYGDMPEHVEHFRYLYLGLEGHTELARWMWASTALSLLAVVLLLKPRLRERTPVLTLACVIVIFATWIEKGAMVVTGFVPSSLGKVTTYWPTVPELLISLAIYAFGALLLTVLYKAALPTPDCS